MRGDPEMPQITQDMYDARERFMLEAQALTAEIQAYMRENGMGGGGGRGFGRGAGPGLDTPQGKLTAAMRAKHVATRWVHEYEASSLALTAGSGYWKMMTMTALAGCSS